MKWIATAVILATSSAVHAQEARNWGVFDGWAVLDDGDGCVATFPQNYLAAQKPVLIRMEPDEIEFVFGAVVPETIDDPDRIDWGRLHPVKLAYAFSQNGPVTQTEASQGFEYVNAKQVRTYVNVNVTPAFLRELEKNEQFFVRIEDYAPGHYPLPKPARALAKLRQCVLTLD